MRTPLGWSALSLAALAAAAVVASLFATWIWAPEVRPSGLQTVVLARGSITVTHGRRLSFGDDAADPPDWQVIRGTPSTYRWHWGPVYRSASLSQARQFILPLWIPAAGLGAVSLWLFSRGTPPESATTGGP